MVEAGFVQLGENMLQEGFNSCLRPPKGGLGVLETMSQILLHGTQQKDKRQQA